MDFITLWTEYGSYVDIGLTVAVIGLLIALIRMNGKFKTTERRYQALTRGLNGADWQVLMEQVNENIDDIQNHLRAHDAYLDDLHMRTQKQFVKRGMVHYDAFEHIHGQLSFSVALLDERNNGYILSNIHGREDARCYCKEIVGGKCAQFMSEEEKAALAIALKGEDASFHTA